MIQFEGSSAIHHEIELNQNPKRFLSKKILSQPSQNLKYLSETDTTTPVASTTPTPPQTGTPLANSSTPTPEKLKAQYDIQLAKLKEHLTL